jgi:putative nucleotidyltransferase with HDIG domain
VETITTDKRTKTPQENLHHHLREVMERHKLPSLPIVVTKVLSMLNDPDFSVRQLSRVISDDTALASRTLAISRSARYAQRHQPTTVHEAVLVLGYQTLRNIVMATAAQSFLTRKSKIAEKLWSHSLAAALTARILSQRAGFKDSELAFLAGLLHDVGEMILLHGDPKGFERVLEEVQQTKEPIVEKEKEMYSFDHSSIGVALLDFWNIDTRIGEAVLCHHDQEDNPNPRSLITMLSMVDYLCFRADLGFSEPPVPPPQVFGAFGCEEEESLEELVQEVRRAFDEESVLFKPA